MLMGGTLTSADDLAAQLDQVTVVGYAIRDGEAATGEAS
jgi:DNA-binding IclR family transcriptional regulator